MILTLTLNPALDKTIYLDSLNLGKLNRSQKVIKDVGGKGINISQVVTKLGAQTVATGFLGGSTGEFIISQLRELGIAHDFIEVTEETRTNLKIIAKDSQQETEINEQGAKVNKAQLTALKKKLFTRLSAGDSLLLAGSLPPNIPADIYAELITSLEEKEVKTFLDTSGLALAEGIKAKPFLVKPNLAELEGLIDTKLSTQEEIVAAAKELQENGPQIVVISRGSKGSLAITPAGKFIVTPPQVKAKSTIGAGDTLLGALALKLAAGNPFKKALRYATAASASTVTKPGTQLCTAAEIRELLPKVQLREIN